MSSPQGAAGFLRLLRWCWRGQWPLSVLSAHPLVPAWLLGVASDVGAEKEAPGSGDRAHCGVLTGQRLAWQWLCRLPSCLVRLNFSTLLRLLTAVLAKMA